MKQKDSSWFFVNVYSSDFRIVAPDFLLELRRDLMRPFYAEILIETALKNQMHGIAKPANVDSANLFDFRKMLRSMLNI
jgi:hypothetical protein